MPRRAAQALLGAAIGVALLAITWVLAFHVGVFERADRAILSGFGDLSQHRHVSTVATFIAELCNPKPYVYLAAIPVAVALIRRRGWLAVAICAILLGANETTQLFKPMLAQARVASVWGVNAVFGGSWPSGHATAAMALALCCVLAAAPRWRPWVAAGGAVFAIAVCYSFLSLALALPVRRVRRLPRRRRRGRCWRSRRCCCSAGVVRSGRPKARNGSRCATRSRPRQRRSPARWCWPRRCCSPGRTRSSSYVNRHHAFVIGAAAIAALALALATGLMLVTTRLAVAARLPQRLRAAIGSAREDEQQVAEAVEVADDLGLYLGAAGDRQALGAAAHGPAHVQLGRGRGAARQHEAVQRLERRVDLVAALLEPGRLLRDDAQAVLVGSSGRRDVGADVEQVVLDPLEPRPIPAGTSSRASSTPSCELSSSTVP